MIELSFTNNHHDTEFAIKKMVGSGQIIKVVVDGEKVRFNTSEELLSELMYVAEKYQYRMYTTQNTIQFKAEDFPMLKMNRSFVFSEPETIEWSEALIPTRDEYQNVLDIFNDLYGQKRITSEEYTDFVRRLTLLSPSPMIRFNGKNRKR